MRPAWKFFSFARHACGTAFGISVLEDTGKILEITTVTVSAYEPNIVFCLNMGPCMPE